MIRPILLSTALIAASLLGATAFSQTTAAPRGEAARKGPAAAAPLDKQDHDFLNDAAMGGLAEVELGQVAQKQALSDDVKRFGQRMVEDHTKLNERLKDIAEKKGVVLPRELDKKHRDMVDKLSKLSGAKFDKEYVKDMVKDHETDLSAFEKEGKNAHDVEIKDLAASSLPTLREHLTLAQQVEAKVKNEK